MDIYTAAMIVDGAQEPEEPDDYWTAWGVLIATGACWTFQGRIGRTANDYIEAGLFFDDGAINWEEIETWMEQ
jgi:hypothetical protein